MPSPNLSLSSYRNVIKDDSALPLYYQVQLILQSLIETEEIKKGRSFYTEEEVAEQLGISRPTVSRAITALIEEGYLTRERGKRARVSAPQKVPMVFMGELLSFGEMLTRLGKHYETVLLERSIDKDPPESVRELLGVPKREPVLFLRRLRYVNKEPIIIVNSFLPSRFQKLIEIPKEEFATDLLRLIKEYDGTEVKRAEREVMASWISPQDANLLQVPVWEPCLRLQGISYSADEQPVEFFDSILKGSRCVLKSQLTKQEPGS
jgi:GntR family transcriptional regulator